MIKEIKKSSKTLKGFGMKLTKLMKSNPELLQQIIEETKFLNENYKFIPNNQRTYHIWNDINHVEVCPFCGGVLGVELVTMKDKSKIFRNYRPSCGKKECIQKHKVKNCLEKYGAESPNQVEEIKLKQRATLLNNYGVEHPSQSVVIKDKIKKVCLQKYGVEHPSQSEKIKLRTKLTCLQKYGVENPSQSEEIKLRKKLTCLRKYGVEFSSQSVVIKDKIKKVCLERYGVEHPSQSEEIKLRTKLTCLRKYGVESPNQVEEIQLKQRATLLNNYGVENPSQSEEIKLRTKLTCLQKYGVESPNQVEEIQLKKVKNSLLKYGVESPNQVEEIFVKQHRYMRKPYTLPSGKIVGIMGYEHIYLNNYFINGGLEENIKCEKIKAISYTLNGKKHKYHPDFYLKNENKIIEVKSKWTFQKDFYENLIKRSACIEQGFDFEFFIYNQKGDRLSELELINKN